jgi:hypothetical protein
MHWYRVTIRLPAANETARSSNVEEVVQVDRSMLEHDACDPDGFRKTYSATRYAIFVQATDAVDAIARARLVDAKEY